MTATFLIKEIQSAEQAAQRAVRDAQEESTEKLNAYMALPWYKKIFATYPWEERIRVAELTTNWLKIRQVLLIAELQTSH